MNTPLYRLAEKLYATLDIWKVKICLEFSILGLGNHFLAFPLPNGCILVDPPNPTIYCQLGSVIYWIF